MRIDNKENSAKSGKGTKPMGHRRGVHIDLEDVLDMLKAKTVVNSKAPVTPKNYSEDWARFGTFAHAFSDSSNENTPDSSPEDKQSSSGNHARLMRHKPMMPKNERRRSFVHGGLAVFDQQKRDTQQCQHPTIAKKDNGDDSLTDLMKTLASS